MALPCEIPKSLLVYVFEPAEGIEHIIRLRARLSQRLRENQEIVGTDESFFGEEIADKLRDLYTEKASVLDEDDDQDQDVDLASVALQVWNSASEDARRQAERLPPVVYATRPHAAEPHDPSGVLAYLRFPDAVDALVRVDGEGNIVSQSMTAILRTAACAPETPALPRRPDHHDLTAQAVERAVAEVTHLGGQLGSLRSTRRKVYERLKTYREALRQTGQDTSELDRPFDALFHFSLTRPARDALTRQLRLGITDPALAEMVLNFYNDERLVRITEEASTPEPVIVCSIGLRTDESLSGGKVNA